MAADIGGYPQAVPGLHPDPSNKAASLKRTNDDMRLRIATLKSALQTERTRNQETHRDKVMEMREIREFAELEKYRELEEQRQLLLEEKATEIQLLQSKLEANKNREVMELMRKRDKEEAERMHRIELERLEAEKALAMRVRSETATEIADRMGRENDNLRRMIAELTDQKAKLERLYMHKSEADANKSEQIRRMHEDQEKKTQQLLREGRREMQREIEARRKQEEKTRKLEAEISKMSRLLNIAEAEKNTIAEDFQRLKHADSWSRTSPKRAPISIGAADIRTPSRRPRTNNASLVASYQPPPTSEEHLLQKKVESDRMVKDLNKKIAALKRENKQLQKEATEARAAPGAQAEAVSHAKAAQAKMESLARRQQTAIKSLEKDLASTRAKLRDMQNQLADSKSALVKAQNEAQSARIAASRAKPREPREDQQKMAALDAAVAKAERAEVQLAEKAAAVDQLRKDLKAAKAEHRKERAEMEDKLAHYTTRSAGSMDEKLTLITKEHNLLETRFAKLRDSMASKTDEIAKLEKERKSLLAKCDAATTAQQELEAATASANEAAEAAESERKKLEKKVAKQTTEITQLKEEISVLQDKIKTEAGQASVAEARGTELADAYAQLEVKSAELAAAKKATELAEAELAQVKNDKAALAARQEQLDAARAKGDEVDELRKHNADLEVELQTKQQALEQLRADQDALTTQLEDAHRSHDEEKKSLEAALQQERESVAELEAEVEQLKTELDNAVAAAAAAAAAPRPSTASAVDNTEAETDAEEAARQAAVTEAQAQSAKDEAANARARAKARKSEEQKRKAAEAEAAAKRAEEEVSQAEQEAKQAEEARLAEEEAQRAADAAAKQAEEEAQRAEEEAKRAMEETKRAEEEAQRAAEAAQQAEEELRQAEEAKAAEEEEAKLAEAAEAALQRAAALEKEKEEEEAAEAALQRAAALEKEMADKEAAEEAERQRKEEEEAAAAATAAAAAEAASAKSEAEAARRRASERKKAKEAEKKAAEEAEAAAAAAAAAEEEEKQKAAAAAEAEAAAAAEAEAAAAAAAAQGEAGEVDEAAATTESRYYIALHDWVGHPEDPSEEDLLFSTDDVLRIRGALDEDGEFAPYDPEDDGFYLGEIATGPRKGEKGVVPSNFIEIMSDAEQVSVQQHVEAEGGAPVTTARPSNPVVAAAAPNGSVEPETAPAVAVENGALDHAKIAPLLAENELEPAAMPRKYYVLHDFDPRAEPGREDVEDELELFRGEYITAVSEIGAPDTVSDGFFLGLDKSGAYGLVPSTFVTDDPMEIEEDKADLLAGEDGAHDDGADGEYAEGEDDGAEQEVHIAQVGDIVIAKFDYDPRAMYPDAEEEDADDQLTFQADERLKIIEPIDEDQYYIAERLITGETGAVPGNFIGPSTESGTQQYTSMARQLNLQ